MKVNICGVPYSLIECEDNFNADENYGLINYMTCEIHVNKNLTNERKKETICHEIVHGMLVHMGYNNLTRDEQFVQALGNAIYQGFEVKIENEE